MLSARHMQRGFSLIELMIAVTLMGIMLALAMPSYRAWIQNTRVRTTAESIQNALQLARSEAVQRNAQVQFVLGANSDWTVGCVTATASCPATIQSRSTSEGSSSSIVVTPTPATGDTVVFNGFGATITAGAPAVSLTQLDVDVDSAVLSAADSRELRITVGLGGSARMCDPNVSSPDPRAC